MKSIPVKLTALLLSVFIFSLGCQKPNDREPEPPTPVSNQKVITSFVLKMVDNPSLNADVIGTITTDSIKLVLPSGSALIGNCIPTITFSGKSLSPGSGMAQNFANKVTYTVTAQDGSTKQYVVVAKTDALPATLYITSKSQSSDPLVNPAKLWALDANTGEIKWKYNATESYSYNHAILNKVLYCTFGKSIVAIDVVTRAVKWKFETIKNISTTPVIANERLYFSASDMFFYCLDTNTGALLWKYKPDSVGVGSLSSPTVVDGIFYCGGADGAIYALDAATGTLKWKVTNKYAPGAGLHTNPSVADGVLYIGDATGNLLALHASDGTEKWRFKAVKTIYSSPTVVDGIIYFGSDDKNLYALDAATGALKWKFASASEVVASPIVAGNLVYFTTIYPSTLYALDAKTGSQKWSVNNPEGSSSPLVYNNMVFWGHKQSVIAYHALTGTQLWRTTTDSEYDSFYISSPLVVDQNGIVYYATESGSVQ